MNNPEFSKLFKKIREEFSEREISSSDIPLFRSIMDKSILIKVLKEILSSDILLDRIANRSYTHALGFDKIVLIDLAKDCNINNKVQLRFHIWDNKNDALDSLESMHEHSFNFISLVLSGKLENQCFEMKEVNAEQKVLIDRLKVISAGSDKEVVRDLNERIEIEEAKKLKVLGSVMYDEQSLCVAERSLREKATLGIDQSELGAMANIEGHYVSNRVSGERDSYKHILKEYLSVSPVEVMSISEGEYYFHPYQYPHRLYYDRDILNSTILLTTPVVNNPQGGSLQRITYQESLEKEYKKLKLTKEVLRVKLLSYLEKVEEK